MERKQSPFGIERRLTPELFDRCVATAREERAKAIAAFGQQVIAAAFRVAARLSWVRAGDALQRGRWSGPIP